MGEKGQGAVGSTPGEGLAPDTPAGGAGSAIGGLASHTVMGEARSGVGSAGGGVSSLGGAAAMSPSLAGTSVVAAGSGSHGAGTLPGAGSIPRPGGGEKGQAPSGAGSGYPGGEAGSGHARDEQQQMDRLEAVEQQKADREMRSDG